MTREQLDAIRARYADEPLLGEMQTDRFGNLITVTREHPVVALLAEVERLTAERDTAMDRMQQAIIDLLNEHNAPLHLIARVVEMEYP